jgi:putative tryptophan/tyrosine transport system substrate-binding protein
VIKLIRISLIVTLLFTTASSAVADGTKRLPTIGLAVPVDEATDAPFQKAFRDGLRDLGYVDGKNVNMIVRYSNGDPAKLHAAIQELVALHVDVLWGDAPALKAVTTTIPIVSAMMGDPVKTGLVASLARPGGNITGLSTQRYDTDPKLLELTKELVPNLKRVCVLFDDSREANLVKYIDNEFRALARRIGLSVCMIPVRTLDDVRAVPKAVEKERPQAVVIWASAFVYQHRQTLINSVAHQLPVTGEGREMAEAGAVLAYSPDFADVFRRSATYVAKILEGARPADLPIEQPIKFQLVVNLKAAKTLGIKIPEAILVRADDVIK